MANEFPTNRASEVVQDRVSLIGSIHPSRNVDMGLSVRHSSALSQDHGRDREMFDDRSFLLSDLLLKPCPEEDEDQVGVEESKARSI